LSCAYSFSCNSLIISTLDLEMIFRVLVGLKLACVRPGRSPLSLNSETLGHAVIVGQTADFLAIDFSFGLNGFARIGQAVSSSMELISGTSASSASNS